MCHAVPRSATIPWGDVPSCSGPQDEIFTLSPKSQALSPWWRSILEPLAELPEPGYAQFAAAVVQRVICDWWHTQGQMVVVGWSPMCGWTQWEADGTNRSFVDGGFNRNPNIHHRHLPKLAERGADMAWARFLIRSPTIHRRDATFAAQVNFGERMKTAALKVAKWISETSELNMQDMLDLAGEVRTGSVP
eukprot:Skav232183  [mRNA]  locus=scaffold4523:30187:32428:- [translate_table: standard]